MAAGDRTGNAATIRERGFAVALDVGRAATPGVFEGRRVGRAIATEDHWTTDALSGAGLTAARAASAAILAASALRH